jgi:hypothetical protein
MELLSQKGADLLSGAARQAASGTGLVQSSPAPRQKGAGATEERVAIGLAVLVILASVFLFFHDLALTGLTWDEWMDFDIARDFHQNRAFLTNIDDPSQGRFSHLVAAGSFALLGESYFAFKLPFVLVGIGGGLWLWWFLAKLVRPVVAAIVAAMYFSCPYVLAASRTGATAGDVLVLATTLGFIVTLHGWIRSDRFWPYGAGCGVACGLAIGAKWTGAVLLGAVGLIWLLRLVQQKRRLFEGSVWTGLLAQQWIAVGLALLASPTLMLGLTFVRTSLTHSLAFTGMAIRQFGAMRAAAPWYYIPAVLISKFSPVQVLLVALEIVGIVVLWARKRKRIGMLQAICLASMLPLVPLATKGFQNAHYYVGAVPAVMILSAISLERWLGSSGDVVRRRALWLSAATVVAQFGMTVHLSPDYLLAGRQFGRFFYSQFAGPAVNHCQGLPFAVAEINRLTEREGGKRPAYILRSCLAVMQHALTYGPVAPSAPIRSYPATGAKTEHYLAIPGSYDYDNIGAAEDAFYTSLRDRFTQGCRKVGEGNPDYELLLCPAR